MDTDVSKAYRTLQRAGIALIYPEMPMEEFQLEYGRLLLRRLQSQGFHCGTTPLNTRPFSSHGEFNSVRLQGAANDYLSKYCQKDIKAKFLHFVIPGPTRVGHQTKFSSDSDVLMADYLSNFSPQQLQICTRDRPSTPDASSRIAILFLFQNSGTINSESLVTGIGALFRYEVMTPEERAAIEAEKIKNQERKIKAAETRKRNQENKEKTLLSQLMKKYKVAGDDPIEKQTSKK